MEGTPEGSHLSTPRHADLRGWGGACLPQLWAQTSDLSLKPGSVTYYQRDFSLQVPVGDRWLGSETLRDPTCAWTAQLSAQRALGRAPNIAPPT